MCWRQDLSVEWEGRKLTSQGCWAGSLRGMRTCSCPPFRVGGWSSSWRYRKMSWFLRDRLVGTDITGRPSLNASLQSIPRLLISFLVLILPPCLQTVFQPCQAYTASSSSTWSPVRFFPIYLSASAHTFTPCTVSTLTPAVMVWVFPGASWFYHQLIPSAVPVPSQTLDPKTHMAVWQLVNCMFPSLSNIQLHPAILNFCHDYLQVTFFWLSFRLSSFVQLEMLYQITPPPRSAFLEQVSWRLELRT